jgi:hypothetical protein
VLTVRPAPHPVAAKPVLNRRRRYGSAEGAANFKLNVMKDNSVSSKHRFSACKETRDIRDKAQSESQNKTSK